MNSRYLLILFSLHLLACQKQSPYDFGEATAMAPPVYVQLSVIPPECTFTQSAAHTFLVWGTQTADEYACSSFGALACNLYVSDEHTEMICQSTAQASASVPSGCTVHAIGGSHEFQSGAISSVDVYNCGAWNTALRCFYFHHAPDVADATRREEIICKQKVIFGGGSFWSKPKD